jgi:hypothetical protein
MSTLVSDVVEDVLDTHLEGTYRAELDELDENIDADDTVIKFRYSSEIEVGSHVGVGYEMCLVKAKAGDEISVMRGMKGSQPTAHVAGEVLDLRPRFSRWSVMRALRAEILSWPAGIYWRDVLTFSSSSDSIDRGYGIDPAGVRRIVSVEVGPASGDTSELFEVPMWRWDPAADTATFEEGGALYLPAYASSRTVKVVLARDFDLSTWSENIDLVEEVGLSEHMLDLAAIGTGWRMLTEVPRTDRQAAGEAARDDAVPAGHISSVKQQLRDDRRARLAEERARLQDLDLPTVVG